MQYQPSDPRRRRPYPESMAWRGSPASASGASGATAAAARTASAGAATALAGGLAERLLHTS